MFDLPVESFFFFFFAICSIVFSVLAVVGRKLIHSAVFLMLVLSISSAFYILLGCEFFAGIQLLLYVGGVLILVLFAIMVTSSNELEQIPAATMRKIFAGLGSIGFFLTCVSIFTEDYFQIKTQMIPEDELGAIGNIFLNYESGGQIISFELISLILLVTLIGGIVIGRKDKEIK